MNEDINLDNLKNTYGKHSVFYYYGYEHLMVSLYYYIKAGINNNELIYFTMFPDLYQKIIADFKINNLPIKDLILRSEEEMIIQCKHKSTAHIKLLINNYITDAIKKGYSGIRFIGQPSYAIKNTSRIEFLKIERVISSILKNISASLLCIYDYYDYLHSQNYINKMVIHESYNTHTHRFSQFRLSSI